ncbi:DUF2325 domain-containing protein [Neobacillus sp.]|jgi:hypothetical protein|uniref:DUF2325 domain-containing protein n=1 Tax=Neobacillus sp. TaxID=2675273 RepID=UPI0035B53D78
MKKTIAIIGGSQESTFKKIGLKMGINVLFHNGKTRNGGNKKEFMNLVRHADCVVVLLGACGHVSMDLVKEVCKKQGKELLFHKGFGASGAIQLCVEHINKAA